MSDVWHVKMPNGEIRTLDVDQLDAAFQAGWVDASTPVLPNGETTWTTLGRAAGLDDEPAPYSIAPMAYEPSVDVDMAGLADAAERPRRWPWVLGFAAVTLVVAAAGFGGMTLAQRTLATAPPPPAPTEPAPAAAPAPVQAEAAPAPTAAAEPSTAAAAPEEAPKATSTLSVADLPPAKKKAAPARKAPRKKKR